MENEENWKSYINGIKLDQVDKFHSIQQKIDEVDQMQVES